MAFFSFSKQKVTWVQQLRQGNSNAFLPFYQKVSPSLMRFLLWKTGGDRPLSEDILQESFVRFLLSIDQIESDEEIAIYSYLFRIVKNCLIDKVSRGSQVNRNQVTLDQIAEQRATETIPQEQFIEMRELQVVLDHLNSKDSEMIWLKDGLGLSHRELAEEFGISEEASRQAYSRAKKNLKQQIKKIFNLDESENVGYVS